MKVRIKPIKCQWLGIKYLLQCKRWFGWKTIGTTLDLEVCFRWIEDLKKIANVEFIKYV